MDVAGDPDGRASRVAYRVEARQGVRTTASRVVTVRPGLLLNISAVQPGVEARFRFDIGKVPVQFGFIVSGPIRRISHDGHLKNKTYLLHQGSKGIYDLPQTSDLIESDCATGVLVAICLTTAAFLSEYFQQDKTALPQAFNNVLHEKGEQFFWRGKDWPTTVKNHFAPNPTRRSQPKFHTGSLIDAPQAHRNLHHTDGRGRRSLPSHAPPATCS